MHPPARGRAAQVWQRRSQSSLLEEGVEEEEEVVVVTIMQSRRGQALYLQYVALAMVRGYSPTLLGGRWGKCQDLAIRP